MQIHWLLHNIVSNFPYFIHIFLFIMQALTNNIYSEVQKEYYNEVHESDSISVWYSPEYYTQSDIIQSEIWY